MNLRRALLSLAACYPLAVVGFFAGMMACDQKWAGVLVLAAFYLFFLFALFHCCRLSSRLFGLAFLLVAVHSLLAARLICWPQMGHSDDLIPPLLLGIPAVQVVLGLAACRLALRLRHNVLGVLLAASALGWLPMSALLGTAAFAPGYIGQGALIAFLSWVVGQPPSAEGPDVGFSPA